MDTLHPLTSESVSDLELTARRIELDDPADAVEYFYRQGWTDGLPVVPPTPERVREFLAFAGNQPGGERDSGRVRKPGALNRAAYAPQAQAASFCLESLGICRFQPP